METTYKIEDFILDESFQRYVLRAHATPSDIKYWESWINDHPEALNIVEQAKEALVFVTNRKVKQKNENIREEVFNKLQKQINTEKLSRTPRQISMKYYWYAASFLLLLTCTITLLKYTNKQESATLSSQFLQVIVPKGQRSQIVLPDGTKVWLNSGSTFKYPVDFMKQGRNVYIEGEAFFDVAHNKNIPFIVHTRNQLAIKVLGTEFNVKCYADEKVIETTLIKGSIKLIQENSKTKEIELKPKQQAIFVKNTQSLEITSIQKEKRIDPNIAIDDSEKDDELNAIETITAWKEEKLIFDNETFEEIAIKMERWYGFTINITDERIKKERFTGKFVNNETIYQILDIFNRSEPITYTAKNKEITITKR